MEETLFILGREPELSVAELESIAVGIGATVQTLRSEAALVHHPAPLSERFLDRLGGSIKQVKLLERWPLQQNLVTTLIERLTAAWMADLFSEGGRIEFGMSIYGASNSERAAGNRQGLRVKKECVATGRPVRYVVSREAQLSAVMVQKNGLLKKGKELVIVKTADELLVGCTVAVQDFESYGLRDFGRPAANAKSGMLPPKLAQMMLNIAAVQPNDVLLDPFCGSGTMLQEAVLLGVQRIHGSDVESRAVKESQENIRWLLKEFPGHQAEIEILLTDARQVSVPATCLVTEPYLGKPLRGHEPQPWLHQQAKELQMLYLRCFEQWKNELLPGARVVMIWPEFTVGDTDVSIDIEQAVRNLGFQQQQLISDEAATVLQIRNPNALLYARQDARVRRILRKWVLR